MLDDPTEAIPMTLDDIKKLHQKKYRDEFGCFLVEGEHLVLELQKAALLQPRLLQAQLYVSSAYEQWQSPFKTQLLSERQMARISDTESPPGILAVVPMTKARVSGQGAGNGTEEIGFAAARTTSTAQGSSLKAVPRERSIYLHEIQDPGNLGTILRTLAWFGGFRCLLSPGSVDPYNPKVVRASMGAIFHVPLELEVELDSLTQRFTRIACLDLQGKALSSEEFKECDCYVFGNEARGVPQQQLSALNAATFTIPGSGTIESLNLAATVNMCLYELNR